MSSEEMLGPVDYLVVEFPADKANFSGEMAAELAVAEREPGSFAYWIWCCS